MIRYAEREANYKKLGSNSNPKTKNATLKRKKRESLSLSLLQDLETLLKIFATTGPKLEVKIPSEA